MKQTFLEYLVEQETKPKNIKPPKPRPPKNLWFRDRDLWMGDLRREFAGQFDLLSDEKDESNIYAMDKDHLKLFGVWHNKDNRGITFAKPRPMNTAVPHRARLKSLNTAPPTYRNF